MFTAKAGILASRRQPSAFKGGLIVFSLMVDNLFHGRQTQLVALHLGPVGEDTPLEVTQYFTTVLYGAMVQDDLALDPVGLPTGLMLSESADPMTFTAPKLTTGTLEVTVSYQETAPQGEALSFTKATLKSGTLLGAIVYQEYRSNAGDELTASVPALTAGTLAVTVNYVSYNPLPYDTVGFTTPTLNSGTLK